ncbi:Abi family protein [Acetobacter syzygii]|uniref:Abi family protein n=1 Tax=Acetobacter syzygii TaxID=146476 RepID=UPI0039E97688
MTEAAEMENALSLERFARYVAWASGDRHRALELYTLNTQLSEALYTPLQVLELALRNRIHTIMSAAYGERWFDTAELLQAPHQREQVQGALAELAKDDKEPLSGRVVAALTFSFWTAMVSPIYENLWRSTLSAIAVKPDGKRLSRKHLSRPLTPIRLLRNRIAHHEPILHWDLRKHHAIMLEMTFWLSPPAARWCVRIDRFPGIYPSDGYQLASENEQLS